MSNVIYWLKLGLPVDLWPLLRFLSAQLLIIWLQLRHLKDAWPARRQWIHLHLDFSKLDKWNILKILCAKMNQAHYGVMMRNSMMDATNSTWWVCMDSVIHRHVNDEYVIKPATQNSTINEWMLFMSSLKLLKNNVCEANLSEFSLSVFHNLRLC